MTQPPILAPDPATGHVYVITEYRERGGHIEAQEQTDVTDAFRATVRWLADTGRLTPLMTGQL